LRLETEFADERHRQLRLSPSTAPGTHPQEGCQPVRRRAIHIRAVMAGKITTRGRLSTADFPRLFRVAITGSARSRVILIIDIRPDDLRLASLME
jgi:hypothetical protein